MEYLLRFSHSSLSFKTTTTTATTTTTTTTMYKVENDLILIEQFQYEMNQHTVHQESNKCWLENMICVCGIVV
jgi:hypothetical protein